VEKDLDVVVVGNVGVDTNVYPLAGEIDWGVEANFTRNLDCVGQAGGFSSRGWARLGRRTAFLGCVGTTSAAAWCARSWRATASTSRACSWIRPARAAA